MEFTRQVGKQCDAALRREEISLLMYYALCFFNADLGAYLITLRKFSPQVNFANFAIQKIREIKVKRAISVAIIT